MKIRWKLPKDAWSNPPGSWVWELVDRNDPLVQAKSTADMGYMAPDADEGKRLLRQQRIADMKRLVWWYLLMTICRGLLAGLAVGVTIILLHKQLRVFGVLFALSWLLPLAVPLGIGAMALGVSLIVWAIGVLISIFRGIGALLEALASIGPMILFPLMGIAPMLCPVLIKSFATAVWDLRWCLQRLRILQGRDQPDPDAMCPCCSKVKYKLCCGKRLYPDE